MAGIHLLKGHIVEAVLEDEAIHRLRQNKKALTMSRNGPTRAQFIKRMFAESGVPLVSKELDKKQPIQTPKEAESEKESRSEKDKKHKPGLSDHAKLTIESVPITATQPAGSSKARDPSLPGARLMSSTSSYALAYARRGWPVFPCQGKEPATAHGFLDATCNEEQIREWWSRDSGLNVAIACGDTLAVLDMNVMNSETQRIRRSKRR